MIKVLNLVVISFLFTTGAICSNARDHDYKLEFDFNSENEKMISEYFDDIFEDADKTADSSIDIEYGEEYDEHGTVVNSFSNVILNHEDYLRSVERESLGKKYLDLTKKMCIFSAIRESTIYYEQTKNL